MNRRMFLRSIAALPFAGIAAAAAIGQKSPVIGVDCASVDLKDFSAVTILVPPEMPDDVRYELRMKFVRENAWAIVDVKSWGFAYPQEPVRWR